MKRGRNFLLLRQLDKESRGQNEGRWRRDEWLPIEKRNDPPEMDARGETNKQKQQDKLHTFCMREERETKRRREKERLTCWRNIVDVCMCVCMWMGTQKQGDKFLRIAWNRQSGVYFTAPENIPVSM